jgi:hypothetical protein
VVLLHRKRTLAGRNPKALTKQGFTAMNLGPEEFGRFYAAEAAKWAKVVDAVGLGR